MTQGLENALWTMCRAMNYDRCYIHNDDNNSPLYSEFFTLDISNPSDVLCPLYCLGVVKHILEANTEERENLNEIVIPINTLDNYYRREFRTIDTALKYVFNLGNSNLGVIKVIVKDEIFYGCRNLLLDDDFNILFMPCIRVDFTNPRFKDYIVVADTSLLNNPDTIVGKAIIRKLIPYYTSRNLVFNQTGLIVDKIPSVFFTNLKETNKAFSTKIVESPYNILNAELPNLINSIDYVT